jgi:carbonic anhydrase
MKTNPGGELYPTIRKPVFAANPAPVQGQTSSRTLLDPEAALKQLMDGNRRFSAGQLTSLHEDLAKLRQSTVDKQEPFAAVLSCADSRVPAELIFDQSIGSIFVTRVAGNIVTPEIIGSLEYGATILGITVIIVIGHSSCGAVTATIQGQEVPGQISSLYAHIRPAVAQAGTEVDVAVRANAKIQAALLRECSPVVSSLMKENKLKVVSAFYDLATGVVSLLE